MCASIRGRRVDESRVHLGTLQTGKIHFELRKHYTKHCLCEQSICDFASCLDTLTAAALTRSASLLIHLLTTIRELVCETNYYKYTLNDKTVVLDDSLHMEEEKM